MTLHLRLLCMISFLFATLVFPVWGQEVPATNATSEFAQLKLIKGEMAPGARAESPSVTLGIDVTLAKGWKVYWRSPGDAGQPISLDWKGSVNVSAVDIQWPAPTRFVEEWGLEVFGYKDHVVFPFVVTRDDPRQPSHLSLLVHYSVCSDICVPYDQTLEMEIPVTWELDAGEVASINAFRDTVPRANGAYGFMIKEIARLEETAEKGVLRVVVESSRRRFVAPDIFIETETGFRFPKPKVYISNSNRRAEFNVPYEITLPGGTLANKTVTVTMVDAARGVETNLVVPEVFATPGESLEMPAEAKPLAWFLLIAFVGGMLLNLMPCVLPVLSIKLMGLIKQSGQARADIRRSLFATTCGIIMSFLVLGGILIAAKEAGQAVGWGFHFQQPVFLIALALVMVLFASKMWGLYDIRLPHFLQSRVSDASHRSGLLGDFASGAFATLLATPCSAPILGTAVGFALSRGAEEIFLIFFVLGLGLSFPYLLGIVFPSLSRILPRPGKWMHRLNQVMGLFLAATALWLIWIVAQQAGNMAAWVVLVSSAAIILVLWMGRNLRSRRRRMGQALTIALLAVLSLSSPGFWKSAPSPLSAARQQEAALWKPFSSDSIPDLVAAGKTVVVDVTADWCLTCTANDLFVWRKPEIVAALGEANVVAMQADWTLPNRAINNYLAGFGRYGIPFAVVYGPGSPEGKALPELLTPALVLDAIAAAKTPVSGCGPAQEKC